MSNVRTETDSLGDTLSDIRRWFFDDYLPTWVAAGAGPIGDPKLVLAYWGVPLHAASVNMHRWLMTDQEVLGLLDANQAPLRAAKYTHTQVLDQRIVVYNKAAGSVDVIWSRRRADESEIERRAVHFELRHDGPGWRIIALASALTEHTTLARVWRAAPALA